MSTQDQARELAAQQRHNDEHLKEMMLNRAEAEVENHGESDRHTEEQARELAAQQRQHDEHLKETMLNRAKTGRNASSETTD